MSPRPFVVQLSFPPPQAVRNPYTIMLTRSMAGLPDVEVRNFSWRGALLGRYDVFHVHWPEILVSGRTPLRALARQSLFVALLVRLAATRTPWVRTLHNVDLPAGISRRERWLLGLADRRTALRITLNPFTPVPEGAPHVMIRHGHYRDWFAEYSRSDQEPGCVAFVGRLRRYKGVESLIEAFRALPAGVASRLVIAGLPSSPELGESLAELAAGDERIELRPAFIPDHDFVQLVTGAELVVLPYRDMHNSGTALAVLSLDRPVLVPANRVNEQLSGEVGLGWVHQFDDHLSAEAIHHALAVLRGTSARREAPNLDAREWDDAARAHVSAYRQARARSARLRRRRGTDG